MSISFFLRGNKAWARIPCPGARFGQQRSLGVSDPAAAKAICGFLDWCVGAGRRDVLDPIAAGTLSPVPAFRAWHANTLDDFMRERAAPVVVDLDLEPFVAKWVGEMERLKKPNERGRAKYEFAVRTLVTKGYGKSAFTRSGIREWLLAIAKTGVTQPNRYRAALSSFAKFLVLIEQLDANPVLGVPAGPEAEPRTRHLTPEQVPMLLDALPEPYRALHAVMLCTSGEVSPVLALHARDIDRTKRTVKVHGTKSSRHGTYRNRTCYVYARWHGVWDRYVEPHLKALKALPGAAVFPGLTYTVARARLETAVEELGWDDYHVHDHRHTWAVQAMRDGLSVMVVAKQLGHVNAVMTLRVYGVFQPTADDFEMRAPVAGSATKGATGTEVSTAVVTA